MLHSCCGNSTEPRFSTQAVYVCSSSPSKLEALQFSVSPNILFPVFNSRSHSLAWHNFHKYTSGNNSDGFILRIKPQCHSKSVSSPKKSLKKGNNRNYGGILPSILRSLEAENDDVGKTLESYHGKLNPKEQTVILKEQKSWDKVLRVFEWFKSQSDYVPNVIHYNVVLRALGRARKWDELRLCWIEMAKVGVLPTNNTYSMLVDVYGKSGLVKESLLWIKHMKLRGIFPDEVTMSTVVKVLKDAEEYDRADKFYKDWCVGKIQLDDLDLNNLGDQQSICLKQFLLSELFRTGVRSKDLGGFDVENSVKKPRLTSTYNTLIDLYGKAGRLKDAADVFSEMLKSGVSLDIFTFNTMIYICGSQGLLSEAEELLNKMEERGIRADTKTYNIFISLYAEAENIDEVLRCYKNIKQVGLYPDNVTYRSILHILCERNMIHEVEDVIEEIEKSEKRVDEKSLPILTRMYVKAGLFDRAKSLIEKSRSYDECSSRIYAAIMDVYAEEGLWEEAEALFYLKREGHEQKKEVLEYNVMIKAFGKAKLYDKAVSLFTSMRNQGTWPDECTYNSLIQMLAGGDLIDESRDYLAEMKEHGIKPSCTSFSAVISGFARNKRLSEAVDLFQEMLRLDVKPNEVVYGLLIDAFAENGEFKEAINYYHAMEDSGISPNQIVLTSVIKAYGKIGSVENARKLYDTMNDMNGGPDIVASNNMLQLYADLGMLSEAKAIYDRVIKESLADGVTFATMMYGYQNMGMLDEAIKVAEEMKRCGLLNDCVTFNKVMSCYSTNGQLVECGELLHEMVVDRTLIPNHGTFKVLFTLLKKAGFPNEAVKQLQSSYSEGKPFAMKAVITSVFSVVGLHAYALRSCGILAKGGDRAAVFDSSAYNAAIRAFAAYGKIDEALSMFMRMQDEGLEPDVVTLINLVNCYGKAGMIEGVKRIHSQLKYGDIEPNESLYKAVMDAYKNANRHDLAELVEQEMKFAFDDERQVTDSELSEESDESDGDSFN